MINYESTTIFMLVCNETCKQFIGSTTESIEEKLEWIQNDYLRFLNGFIETSPVFEILENHLWYVIILEEDVSFNSKDELNARKRFHIKEAKRNGIVVNKFLYYTKDEQIERNRAANRKNMHKFCSLCSRDCKNYYSHSKSKKHLKRLENI